MYNPSKSDLSAAVAAVRGMGASLAQAEDCVQAAYVKVCQKVDPSKGTGRGLLVTAAKRICLDTVGSGEYRSARNSASSINSKGEMITVEPQDGSDPEQIAIVPSHVAALAAAVESAMGAGAWEATLDYLSPDWDAENDASILGIQSSTAATRRSRHLARVREIHLRLWAK